MKAKTIGIVFAAILLAAAVVIAVLGYFKIVSIKDITSAIGISPVQTENAELIWQTSEQENCRKAVISTSLGDITLKLYDCTPADLFVRNGGLIGKYITVSSEKMFIQTEEAFETDAEYEDTGLGCICGAVGLALDDDRLTGSLVFITPEEMSTASKAYIKANPMKDGREKFYESYGGVPELEGKIAVFGQVTDGFKVIEKITRLETDGYTGGFNLIEPVEITCVTIIEPVGDGK